MLKKMMMGAWRWLDDRTGLSETVGPLMTHLAPRDARWMYVFGSATLCAFSIQVVSGIVLAFSYIPSASQAYSTLQYITHDEAFGRFMRGLHYYGASAMILMAGLHMAQVFFYGSYKFPRELNWVTGVLLLAFTLLMGFTGQLLRWDQTAVWSVVVAAEQAGRLPLVGHWVARFVMDGGAVSGSTLTRFFAIHVFLVPGLIISFVGIHLMLVMRHGISEPPKPGRKVDPKTYRHEYEELLKKEGLPFWPDLAWRDVVFSTAMVLGIVALAYFVGPPELGKPPDPTNLVANPRPDWYLLWYFAVLAYLPPAAEKFVMILTPPVVGGLLILLPFVSNKGERSPRRRPWAVALMVCAGVGIGALTVAGVKANWSPNFDVKPLPEEVVGVSSGPVSLGARLFYAKGCLNCHLVQGYGGRRGPDLTDVGDRLTKAQMILRIANGGGNMPAFAPNLKPGEMDDLVAFLQSRRFAPPKIGGKP